MGLSNLVKREYPWIIIFLATQIGIFSFHYRDFESKFFPVVNNFRVVHVLEQSEETGSVVYVKFDKLRGCELVGVRMTDSNGWRVNFKFLEDYETDDSYKSRGLGNHVTGPWWINTVNWSNIQIEAIHKCDPFGNTISYIQKIK